MSQAPTVAKLYSQLVIPPGSGVRSRGALNLVEYVEILPTPMESLVSLNTDRDVVDFHETGVAVSFLTVPRVLSLRDLKFKLAVTSATDDAAVSDMMLEVYFDVLVVKNTGTPANPVITRDRYLDRFHGLIVSGNYLEFSGLNYVNIFVDVGESLCFSVNATPVTGETTAITGLSVSAHTYLDQN